MVGTKIPRPKIGRGVSAAGEWGAANQTGAKGSRGRAVPDQ